MQFFYHQNFWQDKKFNGDVHKVCSFLARECAWWGSRHEEELRNRFFLPLSFIFVLLLNYPHRLHLHSKRWFSPFPLFAFWSSSQALEFLLPSNFHKAKVCFTLPSQPHIYSTLLLMENINVSLFLWMCSNSWQMRQEVQQSSTPFHLLHKQLSLWVHPWVWGYSQHLYHIHEFGPLIFHDSDDH